MGGMSQCPHGNYSLHGGTYGCQRCDDFDAGYLQGLEDAARVCESYYADTPLASFGDRLARDFALSIRGLAKGNPR